VKCIKNESLPWVINERLYEVAKITRQGFSKYLKREDAMIYKNTELVQKVNKLRTDHKRMGSRSLFYLSKIKNIDLGMGINKFERMLSNLGLTIKQKIKHVRTTIPVKHQYPNLISGLVLNNINMAVSGDITYYENNGKRYYIFTLKDLYSKRIVGLVGAENMYTEIAIMALNQMIQLRGKRNLKGLCHHTDAGGQYLSIIYKYLLNKYGIEISIAKNCLENGSAEQLNGILKNDYLINYDIKNVTQLNKILKKIKRLINEEKPVKALSNKTPIKYEEYIANMKPENRPKVALYEFNKH
jgi:transposase InsO family protein